MSCPRIKTQSRRHKWRVSGGYDPELDGEDAQWGRRAIECRRCGEQRRIWRGTSLSDIGLVNGCAGRRFKGRYSPGDYVVVGGRLDTFARYLPGGQCETRNAGGGRYVQAVTDVSPSLAWGASRDIEEATA
jgi:hypothetical protein